jgi:hypothetical protein
MLPGRDHDDELLFLCNVPRLSADSAVSGASTATLHAPSSASEAIVASEVARRRAGGRWVYLIDDPFFVGASVTTGLPTEQA